MRILIAGGGTGGHIYPAIAIANRIREEYPDWEILFVGTKRGLEYKLVPEAGYRIQLVRVSGFKRRLSLDTFKSVRDLFDGLKDARKVIKDFKPDIVIGTGGYVCGPILWTASMMQIKTIIHEQNVIPGVTNKILGKFVDRIMVSFEDSRKYFQNSSKIVVTGNPVRKEFIRFDREQSRRNLGIKDNCMLVMSFGGSRGAEKINEIMKTVVKKMSNKEELQLIHITGSSHYELFMKDLEKENIIIVKNIMIKPYAHDMPALMGACDLVICRSGAITLAEITAMGLPSILIPSPHVTNNHQEHNARVLEKKGAAVLLLERELNDKNIVELLSRFTKEKHRLVDMGEKSKLLSKTDATEIIFSNIMGLLQKSKSRDSYM